MPRNLTTALVISLSVWIAAERDKVDLGVKSQYRLLATAKTSTLQKELGRVGDLGFGVLGMTVGRTALGGRELVAITRRVRAQ